MNFLVLDLEMNKPSGTIIQVGACVGNLETGEVLEVLEQVVNPEEILDPYIIDLTGITQFQVDHGTTLPRAYQALVGMQEKYDCFMNAVTWGGGDTQVLQQQLTTRCDYPWKLGRRWIDAKTLYTSWCWVHGRNAQGGLAKALTRFDLQFVGRKHQAHDDAINTWKIYHRLLKEFRNAAPKEIPH